MPLWDGLLDLKLGWQTNLEIYRIMVLFENVGICVFYKDKEVQKKRVKMLNDLEKYDFKHSIFNDGTEKEKHISLQKNY